MPRIGPRSPRQNIQLRLPAGTKIEVECDRIEQVQAAVDADADIVMFDNMHPDEMARCVELVAGRAITEASGRVRLENVRAIALAGSLAGRASARLVTGARNRDGIARRSVYSTMIRLAPRA